MTDSFLIYLIVGKILIFFLMRFVEDNKILEGKSVGKLFRCGLCLGVWVYTPLACLLETSIFDLLPMGIFSNIITGMTTSFVVHVFSVGWNTLFSTVTINYE